MAGLRPLRLAVAGSLCSLLLLLTASPSVLAQATTPQKASTRVPQPVIEPARGGQCVEDPVFMRRNHADLLKHQRDETLRGGVRAAKYSLKACIECHASQTTRSVAATQTNFCQSCHIYTAVKIDCFECHASKPQQNSPHPLVAPGKPGAATQLGMQLRQMAAQPQPFKP